VTRGQLQHTAGLLGLNGGGTAAAVLRGTPTVMYTPWESIAEKF